MNIQYSSLGKQLSMKADLAQMSGRDKVNLFNDLLTELGITERLTMPDWEADLTYTIINQQLDKHWKGK